MTVLQQDILDGTLLSQTLVEIPPMLVSVILLSTATGTLLEDLISSRPEVVQLAYAITAEKLSAKML